MIRVYEIDASSSRRNFEKRIKDAKHSTLRLTNAKQILDIEYTDLKLLLTYNPKFFEHCMKVADKVVAQFIRAYKEMYADSEYEEDEVYYEMLKDVETLDDLLYSCDYFGTDYESRRKEFANTFVENRWDFEEYFA